MEKQPPFRIEKSNSNAGTHLSEIFHSYYSDLYYYGLKICREEDLTKDCIQDLFVTLWKSKLQLSQVRSIKSYLLKSLRRSIVKAIQKKKKKIIQAELFSSYEPDLEFSHEDLIIAAETENEKKQKLIALINNLPKRQREVIYLKYYEDLTYEEIAEIMSLNYQSVINHIHKAFKTIRKAGIMFAWLTLVVFVQHGRFFSIKGV